MIAVLCLLAFTDMFGYAIVVPVLPYAARSFGASTVAVGAIFASYSLCQLVSAPVIGGMSDRFGRRALLLVSQSGSVIGFAIMALARSVGPLFVSRIVDGATAGNISIVWAAVLDHYEPRSWGRRFSNLTAATGLGILGGLVVSSILARFGLALVALVAMALIVVNMAITARAFPERTRPASSRLSGQRTLELLRDPRNSAARRVIAASLLSTVAQSAFLLALPLFLAEALHFGAQQSAVTLTGLFAVAALFQVTLLVPVVGCLGDRRSALLGFVLVVLGGLTLAIVRALGPVVGAGALVMWGVVLLNPSLTALLGATNRSLDRGAIMGVNQSIASAGQMVGPLISYGALAVLSTRGYGAACAMLALAGGLVTLRIRATDATS